MRYTLRALIADAGLVVVQEQLAIIGTLRRMPPVIARYFRDNPLTQDVVLNNIEYVLARR